MIFSRKISHFHVMSFMMTTQKMHKLYKSLFRVRTTQQASYFYLVSLFIIIWIMHNSYKMLLQILIPHRTTHFHLISSLVLTWTKTNSKEDSLQIFISYKTDTFGTDSILHDHLKRKQFSLWFIRNISLACSNTFQFDAMLRIHFNNKWFL